MREENLPAKNSGHKIILDVIYDSQRETRTDSSMAFLYKTFDKWVFELGLFLLHMSCGTQEANFCACIRLGLAYVDF